VFRMSRILMVAIGIRMTCLPISGSAQSRDPMRDLKLVQRLNEAVTEHFKATFVESKVGTLRKGGRVAQVVITDSSTFHASPETQRQAAQAVATYVRQQLSEEKDLRTIRIGWKYAPPGGVSTAVMFEFLPEELEPAGPKSAPS
jgi:hypothetical protein